MIYKIFRRWIPLAFLATALCGLVYLAVQQSIRQDANNPQIQMAEDAATALQTSTSTQAIIPSGAVNINESLAPYIVVYNASGQPVAGNGWLNGTLPNLPAGVFNYTMNAGEDRFTWQPAPNIRQAIVITRAENASDTANFVMAGRSLREVEINEDRVEFETGAVWCLALGGLLILEIIFALIESWMISKPEKSTRRSRSSKKERS